MISGTLCFFVFFFPFHHSLSPSLWRPPAFLSRAVSNQLPSRSHKQQPGKWWMSSRPRSDRFFKKMPRLCWPTSLFLSNHLSSRATAGSRGCHGDQWPAWRVIRKLDSLWLLAWTHNWKSQICQLKKWWQQLPAWLILCSVASCNSAKAALCYHCKTTTLIPTHAINGQAQCLNNNTHQMYCTKYLFSSPHNNLQNK